MRALHDARGRLGRRRDPRWIYEPRARTITITAIPAITAPTRPARATRIGDTRAAASTTIGSDIIAEAARSSFHGNAASLACVGERIGGRLCRYNHSLARPRATESAAATKKTSASAPWIKPKITAVTPPISHTNLNTRGMRISDLLFRWGVRTFTYRLGGHAPRDHEPSNTCGDHRQPRTDADVYDPTVACTALVPAGRDRLSRAASRWAPPSLFLGAAAAMEEVTDGRLGCEPVNALNTMRRFRTFASQAEVDARPREIAEVAGRKQRHANDHDSGSNIPFVFFSLTRLRAATTRTCHSVRRTSASHYRSERKTGSANRRKTARIRPAPRSSRPVAATKATHQDR